MVDTIDGSFSLGDIDGLSKAITFILAGLSGGVLEFDVFSISLQRVSAGDFRCILRGARKEAPNAGVRLVAFSNADDPAECLLYAEGAFASGRIRWHIDQYAAGSGSNGATSSKPGQLTLID